MDAPQSSPRCGVGQAPGFGVDAGPLPDAVAVGCVPLREAGGPPDFTAAPADVFPSAGVAEVVAAVAGLAVGEDVDVGVSCNCTAGAFVCNTGTATGRIVTSRGCTLGRGVAISTGIGWGLGCGAALTALGS